jgi:RimJ/RimL family protein N-acetyltransferase
MRTAPKTSRARGAHPRRGAAPTFVARRGGAPWTETVTLSNRRRVVLRPIRADDTTALRRGFAALSPEDVRLRFLHPITEMTEELAQRLCTLDARRELALVLAEPPPEGDALVGAVARATIPEGGDTAEFALIVARPLRGYGLGEHLLRKLIGWARRKRMRRIVGHVLNENDAMLALAAKLGFTRASASGEPGVTEIQLALART